MKNKNWIFFSISFLCIVYFFLGSHKWLSWFFMVLWTVRVLRLRDKKMIFQILLFCCVAFSVIKYHELKNNTQLTGKEETFVLAIDRRSLKVDGDYLSCVGQIENTGTNKTNEKLAIQYYIPTKEEHHQWRMDMPPSKIWVQGELIEPAQQTNFNQFSYRDYLKRQKIHWQLRAEEIKITQENPCFFQKIDGLRFRILQDIDRHFQEKVASYVKILFMGEGTALAHPVKESYRALGIIHLFSISGFHISYLAKVIQRFFLRLGVTHERTNLLLMLILPFYGLLAGQSISIFRAVTQKMIHICGVILNKEINSLDVWSLTLIIALALNPYIMFEVAFQLSYSLSLIFILMGQQQWVSDLTLIKQSLLFSALAMLISLPILSYHFYEISWFTLFSNLLFIPIFMYLLFPVLAVLVFLRVLIPQTLLFISLNHFVGMTLSKLEGIVLKITQRINFSFIIGRLPYFILVILIGLILSILIKVEQRRRISIYIQLAVCFCVLWNRLSPVGYVLMLDVGQGDSILIKEPRTRKISLIDTGGRVEWQEKEDWQKRAKEFSIGKNIVVPSMKSLGISHIDRLYISHAHADHMGEIQNINEELLIKEIAGASQTLLDPALQKQIQSSKQTKIYDVQMLTKINYPTDNTWALHPLIDYPDKNNQSLVLYVKIGEDKWLFTGDLEAEGEKDIIQTFPSLKIDYLKIGHHGSLTSSTEELLMNVRPRAAFISVGAKNTYGHPSPEVLQRLQEQQIPFFTTAEQGAIKINYFKVPFVNKWFKKIETVK